MSAPEQMVAELRGMFMRLATETEDDAAMRRINTARAAAALIRAQAERVRVLESALAEIAKQVPAKDMDDDYYEAADFEDGYDRCVFAARAALKAAP